MNNRFEALKVFCSLAETLQFKETASRLAVSPPVVSRVIAELEAWLGEPLFQRNTRQVNLTEFGQQFLPQAIQLLEDSERLFTPGKKQQAEAVAGLVRVTVPDLPDEDTFLLTLLERLQPYPELVIDWRKDTARLNVVDQQIDLGVRIGMPADNRFIVRKVGEVREHIVATPELVKRHGQPADWQALQQHWPLAANIDANTGRPQNWYLNRELQFLPRRPVCISNEISTQLQIARAGKAAVLLLDWLCRPYLDSGELVELLPDLARTAWPVYVYRPQRTVTPLRVNVVFDTLAKLLQERLPAITSGFY